MSQNITPVSPAPSGPQVEIIPQKSIRHGGNVDLILKPIVRLASPTPIVRPSKPASRPMGKRRGR